MLKKNRSAPSTAVIPVLYYPDVREAVECSQRPCHLPNVSAIPRIGVSSCTATGPSSSPNPEYTLTPLLRHSRAPQRTPSYFVSRRSTNSLDAPRQPVLVFSLNPRITVRRTPMLVPRPMGTSVDTFGDDLRFRPSQLGR
jgi:hypothetical protein